MVRLLTWRDLCVPSSSLLFDVPDIGDGVGTVAKGACFFFFGGVCGTVSGKQLRTVWFPESRVKPIISCDLNSASPLRGSSYGPCPSSSDIAFV